jgi:hypothetical protein
LAQSLIELGPTQGTARSPARLQKRGSALALLCAIALGEGLGCHSLRPPGPKLAQNDADHQSRSDDGARLSDGTKKPGARALPQTLAALFSFLSRTRESSESNRSWRHPRIRSSARAFLGGRVCRCRAGSRHCP